MTRHAISIPPFCSSCFNRPDESQWVDFEAAYDGPVIPGTPANVPLDDLILCENCVKEAARLVGMVHDDEAKARITELEGAVAERDEEIKAKDTMISHLDKTVAEAIDHPVKRGHGKPTFKGPESHAEELAEMRRNRLAREKRGKAKKKVTA
jgi:hypothetical protein